MKKTILTITLGLFMFSKSHAITESDYSSIDNNDNWHCVSQQRLMGQWTIDIQKTSRGLIATTIYKENFGPHNKPEINNIAVNKSASTENESLFLGNEFSLKIYPQKKPKNNPFRDSEGVVAAKVIGVKFAENAKLTNRPFACVHP